MGACRGPPSLAVLVALANSLGNLGSDGCSQLHPWEVAQSVIGKGVTIVP